MATLITKGIKVSVETFYQNRYSNPIESKFVFAYRITIENLSAQTVQLLRRHWYIVESNGESREVEGEGVVGKQPVLHPGDTHQYVSWSQISTALGKMYGTYLMLNKSGGEKFYVSIPEFHLVAPAKLN